ncbi:hypothetical protein [Sporomusa acidovorans]|uniref:hypothetical protein n=1 Tax=Sporomusa acidovorans TaxID=112900 RepID=UPI00359F7E96
MPHSVFLNISMWFGFKENYLTGRATLIFTTAEQQKNNDNYYKATKAASTSKAAESAKSHMCASHP